MTSYWPLDVNLKDISSPLEIIQKAKQEWHERSEGMLTLIIQTTEQSNKNEMFVVHAKHVPSSRTATLFSVVHRSGAPYPARIEPKGEELPNLFKKSYYKPGLADIASSTALSSEMSGRTIKNEWVCDTPAEFRSKLEKVFNLGSLKSEVFNLVSIAPLGTAET